MTQTLSEIVEQTAAWPENKPVLSFEAFAHAQIKTGIITWVGEKDTSLDEATALLKYTWRTERVVRVRVVPIEFEAKASSSVTA